MHALSVWLQIYAYDFFFPYTREFVTVTFSTDFQRKLCNLIMYLFFNVHSSKRFFFMLWLCWKEFELNVVPLLKKIKNIYKKNPLVWSLSVCHFAILSNDLHWDFFFYLVLVCLTFLLWWLSIWEAETFAVLCLF